MRHILLLLALFSTFIFGAIDECKTDIYFGNGILTKEGDAEDNAKLLENAIKHQFYNGKNSEMKKHIGKFDYAYNSTHLGGLHDLIESLYQKLSLTDYLDKLAKLWDKMRQTAHEADLSEQVNKYKSSIRDGHKVLVVAHSQGNLFAQEAYEKLGERSAAHEKWLQKYWEAVSIASPDPFTDIKPIGWDNDLVAIGA